MEMTWEDKLAALKEIAPTSLEMRKPGDWYVHASGREVQREGSGSLSGEYGNGRSPEEAVEDDWRKIAGLPEGFYVVINAMGEDRLHLRWSGRHWSRMPLPRLRA